MIDYVAITAHPGVSVYPIRRMFSSSVHRRKPLCRVHIPTELRNAVLPSEFFLSRMLSGHLLRSARFTVHKIATDCVPMRHSKPRVTIPKRGIYSSSNSFTLSWYGIRYKQGPLNRIRIELKAFSCWIYGHSLRTRGRSAALATPSYKSKKVSVRFIVPVFASLCLSISRLFSLTNEP